jgi:hypothetical protein
MARSFLQITGFPRDLKSKIKRLAQLNNISCSELIRLSIEAKLSAYEAEAPAQTQRIVKQPGEKTCPDLMEPLQHHAGGQNIP